MAKCSQCGQEHGQERAQITMRLLISVMALAFTVFFVLVMAIHSSQNANLPRKEDQKQENKPATPDIQLNDEKESPDEMS